MLQSRTSRLLACTIVLVLAACADVASAERSDTPTTSPSTTAAEPETTTTTTTTVDPAAVAAWFEAVAANQRAEAARLQAEAARRRQEAPLATSQRQTTPSRRSDGLIPARLPCAIPAYICQRESGMTINAKNPASTASGKYQFLDSTWAGFQGYRRAMDAPEEVQDAKARALWAGGAGCSHWSAC